MGTEVAISFSSLRAQLETEKSSLFKIDENIKKIVQTTGRFNDRFNSTGEYPRVNNRAGGRNPFPDGGNNFKNDEQFAKRKHETKTVFSRLSARVHDSDNEDDGPGTKRARVPSAVCRELPTRAAVLRAQGDDEQARTRNRRIFGSLLGTLQKFKQEEIVLQTKEEKRAQVERKIEEQARLEKEREQKERKTLFAERDHKKATIKALEAKMARVQEFEKWEASQKSLGNFILTKAKPHVYWLPKKMTEKATERLESSRKFHEKCMTKKRQELQEELVRIESRCLRPRGPGAKENDPEPEEEQPEAQEPGVKKRDKFAMDVDKEDSDNDDRHDDEPDKKDDKESDNSPADTTIDNTIETMDTTAAETTQISMEASALDVSDPGTEHEQSTTQADTNHS
ncbi:desmosome associated protein-like protein pinnin [Anticarsia gemmatalis]|uniref:desmosome associated protein-like protein pinnin n=1 Tax=Anticarsia gemmatalis TaxID=129554 RepID=UPI003F75C138